MLELRDEGSLPINTVLVVDTLLIAVLTLLVVGLLRSHAELLRRTSGTPSEPTFSAPQSAAPESRRTVEPRLLPPLRSEETPASDVSGSTLDRGVDKVAVASKRDTLLAFLSSGCLTCKPFWDGLNDVEGRLPGDARLVVVTKDPAYESPSRLRELAPPDTRLIMSSQAWQDYKIAMSPYFIHIEGRSGRVASEGSAMSWDQVISLLRDAVDDYQSLREEARHFG